MSCGSLALSLSLISLNLLVEGTGRVVVYLLRLGFLTIFRALSTCVVGCHLLLEKLLHRLLMGFGGLIVGLVVRVHFATTSGAVKCRGDDLGLLMLIIFVCWVYVDAITASALRRSRSSAFCATHSVSGEVL